MSCPPVLSPSSGRAGKLEAEAIPLGMAIAELRYTDDDAYRDAEFVLKQTAPRIHNASWQR